MVARSATIVALRATMVSVSFPYLFRRKRYRKDKGNNYWFPFLLRELIMVTQRVTIVSRRETMVARSATIVVLCTTMEDYKARC